MFEKVSPMHVDKIADRISGAIVDLAYELEENPKVAVEVMIGHGYCHIIVESSKKINVIDICDIVDRVSNELLSVDYKWYPQDIHLARNQKEKIRCGDNGIFRGVPLTEEQKTLSKIAREMYEKFPYDGKFVLDGKKLIICQSNAKNEDIRNYLIEKGYGDYDITINPLGEWYGGTQTDTGAVSRKLGSDMADSVTGGGLHGKDSSKADVSVNIYAFLKAQEIGRPVSLCCAIGDTEIDGIPYSEIVEKAREYIASVGGFEKFAEWGLF
jgi:S-adenosylmethionine synthetase